MTRLVAALRDLGLDGEIADEGHRITLRGVRCLVYVVAAPWGSRYYTWCDDPGEQTVEAYTDPVAAIQAGLQRAARPVGVDVGQGA